MLRKLLTGRKLHPSCHALSMAPSGSLTSRKQVYPLHWTQAACNSSHWQEAQRNLISKLGADYIKMDLLQTFTVPTSRPNKVKFHTACLTPKRFRFPCYSYTCPNMYLEILKKWSGGCGKLTLRWDQNNQKAKADVKLEKSLGSVYLICLFFQVTTSP